MIARPDPTRVLFYWNFNSEEFVEWCGSIYQDYFRVSVTTDIGTQTLFYRKVDDLCGMVFPTSLYFDQSGPGCVPCDGVNCWPKNDCTVWSTGWQLQSIDISGIAAVNQNKPVTIKFSAGDVGDSIFDSAILLDAIGITKP